MDFKQFKILYGLKLSLKSYIIFFFGQDFSILLISILTTTWKYVLKVSSSKHIHFFHSTKLMVKVKEVRFKEFFSNAQLTYDTLTCPYLKLWAWAPTGSPCRNPPTAVLTPSRLRFLSPSGSSSILTQGNTTVTCFLIKNTTMNTIEIIIPQRLSIAFVDIMKLTFFWHKFQKIITFYKHR